MGCFKSKPQSAPPRESIKQTAPIVSNENKENSKAFGAVDDHKMGEEDTASPLHQAETLSDGFAEESVAYNTRPSQPIFSHHPFSNPSNEVTVTLSVDSVPEEIVKSELEMTQSDPESIISQESIEKNEHTPENDMKLEIVANEVEVPMTSGEGVANEDEVAGAETEVVAVIEENVMDEEFDRPSELPSSSDVKRSTSPIFEQRDSKHERESSFSNPDSIKKKMKARSSNLDFVPLEPPTIPINSTKNKKKGGKRG